MYKIILHKAVCDNGIWEQSSCPYYEGTQVKGSECHRYKVLAVNSKGLDIYKASRMDFKNNSKYEKEKVERISCTIPFMEIKNMLTKHY